MLDDLDEGAFSNGGEIGEGIVDYLMHKTPLVAVKGTGGSRDVEEVVEWLWRNVSGPIGVGDG